MADSKGSGDLNRRTFLAAVSCGALAAQGPEPRAIKPAKTIRLFNGKDLTGLYTFLRGAKYEDPEGVFTVKNGLLRIGGEDWGGIATKNAYRDYHLRVEWRWGGKTYGARIDKARDSGILLHCRGADDAHGKIWPESVECQVIEGGCGDIILVGGANKPSLTVECRVGPDKQHYWEKGGEPVTKNSGRFNWYGRDVEWKDRLGFRGRQDVEHQTGEWNVSEAICDGDSITNLVNGVVVMHGTKSSHTEGKIMIQAEGAELYIRRFELGPVKRKS